MLRCDPFPTTNRVCSEHDKCTQLIVGGNLESSIVLQRLGAARPCCITPQTSQLRVGDLVRQPKFGRPTCLHIEESPLDGELT